MGKEQVEEGLCAGDWYTSSSYPFPSSSTDGRAYGSGGAEADCCHQLHVPGQLVHNEAVLTSSRATSPTGASGCQSYIDMPWISGWGDRQEPWSGRFQDDLDAGVWDASIEGHGQPTSDAAQAGNVVPGPDSVGWGGGWQEGREASFGAIQVEPAADVVLTRFWFVREVPRVSSAMLTTFPDVVVTFIVEQQAAAVLCRSSLLNRPPCQRPSR
ncbi:hypothetical protein WJX72_002924 [[Myrmecia] bisecta]|uniref:Uncharacterized protein n=1 Tax=[Myrmecia] bisecta TaxID=41462 RepID=A0AAW1R616_9CHLO